MIRRFALGGAVIAMLLTGCSGEGEPAASTRAVSTPAVSTPAPGTLWSRAPRPAVTGATGAIDPAWVDADSNIGPGIGSGGDPGIDPGIDDGIYWGTQAGDGRISDTLLFDLQQAYFGEFCIAHFGNDDPDACVDDYGVVTDPRGILTVPTDALVAVGSVSVVDSVNQRNYAVTGAELATMLGGESPAEVAPADYVYTDFPFLITITGGTVVSAVQLFTP